MDSLAIKNLKNNYPWVGDMYQEEGGVAGVICQYCNESITMMDLHAGLERESCPLCLNRGLMPALADDKPVAVVVHNLHDEHYASKGIEPINVQEQTIEIEGVPRRPALCIAQAIRYLMRAGSKKGEPWVKDVEKAYNYLHRALHGTWIGGRK